MSNYLTEDNGGGNPSVEAPLSMAHRDVRTFAAFTTTDVCRRVWGRDLEFQARLLLASAEVDNLNALKRWAKERYPDHYSSDWRKTTGKPYSREAMQRLWADYLSWKEEVGVEH